MPKFTVTLSDELGEFYRIIAKRDNQTTEERLNEALAFYAELLETRFSPQHPHVQPSPYLS